MSDGAGAVAALVEAAGRREPRPLAGLVERLGRVGQLIAADPAGAPVTQGVGSDSRRIRPGGVFVAIPGAVTDGHRFAAEAIGRGATAIIVEYRIDGLEVPQLVVASGRRALAEAAAWWFDDPSREIGVIGITGTDGKTTTAMLAAASLEAAGIRTGLISTVATRVGGLAAAASAHATTPEAPEIQAALRAMVDAGDRAVVLETTSHGLALDRVAAVAFDIAVLTNVTSEHLELHGSVAAYRAAKRSLFERLGRSGPKALAHGPAWSPTGIVNADDDAADEFTAATVGAGARVLRYGSAAGAEVRLLAAEPADPGLRLRFVAPSGPGEVRLLLDGRFNVANALAVVALGEALGLAGPAVASGIASVTGVPGRMVTIDAGQPFTVVVDFAHTAAALAAALDAVGSRAAGSDAGRIVVFGSAGERDRGKRPAMGRVAAERCRLVILTDEDPRGEDRDAILAQIAAGAASAGAVPGRSLLTIPDRRAAIRAAFEAARPGDVVLLAGKGHETTIETAGGPIAWDEAEEARAALAELGFRRT